MYVPLLILCHVITGNVYLKVRLELIDDNGKIIQKV